MMARKIKDQEGIYTDCFGYIKPTDGRTKKKCQALSDFYNVADDKHKCEGCPFYKKKL